MHVDKMSQLLINSSHVVCIIPWQAVVVMEVPQGFTKSRQTDAHGTMFFSSGTPQCRAGHIMDCSTETISLLYSRQSHYNNDAPYPNKGQYSHPFTSFVVTISFIHSVFYLMTGPKPPLKRCFHIVRSRASSFK